jgi:LemA protein
MNIILVLVGVCVLVGLFLVFFVISTYNGLIRRRNEFENSFKQIDVQLKRRYDLIPNLVETAKKFMAHERETLEGVVHARNQAAGAIKELGGNVGDAKAMKKSMQMEGMLGQSLGKLFALSESYPDLKSDSTMTNLMEELSSTENKISFARQHYNDSVTVYNNAREVFPSNLIAGTFNFAEGSLWEITDSKERKAVKVSF